MNLYKSNHFGYFYINLRKTRRSVNIYNKSSLIDFYKKHSDTKVVLEKWYHDVRAKNWKKPSDITKDFSTSRTIKNNMAIFKINENDYRLIVEINYVKNWMFIKFVGTHSQYDKINAETVDLYLN